MKHLATFFSTVLHPLLLPTLGLLVIFSTNSHFTYVPLEFKRYIVLVTLVSTCILPLSVMPLFYQLRVIKSIKMETTKERIMPLITTAFFFGLGYIFLSRFQLPSFIRIFYSGTIVAVVCALAITLIWKVSIHMVGIGGIFGALIALNITYGINTLLWLTVVLIIAGIVGTSRLKLNAHSPSQVYIGFSLGVASLLAVSLF